MLINVIYKARCYAVENHPIIWGCGSILPEGHISLNEIREDMHRSECLTLYLVITSCTMASIDLT